MKVKVKSLSRVRLFGTSWAVACTRLLHPWDFLGQREWVAISFFSPYNKCTVNSSHHGQQKSPKCSTWMQSQKWQNDHYSFPRQTIHITIIQAYALTSNAEEAEVEQFYEDLQDLLELTAPKDVLFITGDWNAKVGSQETPGVTGKFGLGIRNEAGQRLIEFCQENALVIANTLFQQHKRRLYTWTSPVGQHWNQIDYILCSQRWRSSI